MAINHRTRSVPRRRPEIGGRQRFEHDLVGAFRRCPPRDPGHVQPLLATMNVDADGRRQSHQAVSIAGTSSRLLWIVRKEVMALSTRSPFSVSTGVSMRFLTSCANLTALKTVSR